MHQDPERQGPYTLAPRRAERTTGLSRLIQRLDPDHRRTEVAAEPNGHRTRAVIYEDPANIGAVRQEVVNV